MPDGDVLYEGYGYKLYTYADSLGLYLLKLTATGETVASYDSGDYTVNDVIIAARWYAETHPYYGHPYSNVTISVTGNGTTSPAAGTYASTYQQTTDLHIFATADDDWYYSETKRDGNSWTNANPAEINNLAETETIEVVFVETPPEAAATTSTVRMSNPQFTVTVT